MVGIIVALLVVILGQALQPKGRLSCASFGSYRDIPSDWQITAPWLDGLPKNDIPCDSRFKSPLTK